MLAETHCGCCCDCRRRSKNGNEIKASKSLSRCDLLACNDGNIEPLLRSLFEGKGGRGVSEGMLAPTVVVAVMVRAMLLARNDERQNGGQVFAKLVRSETRSLL